MNEAVAPDGTGIAWEESGRGPGLVLVHSLGTDSGMWKATADSLADRHRVVRMDLRGHGRSKTPAGPYTVDMLVEDLLAVADAARLDSFHVAGISIGGQVALGASIRRPDRILSAVLSNTAAKLGTPERWQERVEAVRSLGMEGLSRQVASGWFSDGFETRHPDRWEEALAVFRSTAPEGYIGCCHALAAADLRDQLAQVTVPTLIVGGEADRSTPPSDAEWLHERIPGSRLAVMAGCAHLPPLERPQEYAALLAEWLQDGW